jgi:DNA (cytosine-5)-methyltransferase 1
LSIKIIDLFAGAGGLSAGLEMLGCQTILSIDSDAHCAETLKLNKPEQTQVLQCDLFGFDTRSLRELSQSNGSVLGIVGGPPCQPFSKNSYWTEKGLDAEHRRLRAKGVESKAPSPLSTPRDDNRRFLIDTFADAVKDASPDFFIFENVASIMHPRNKGTFDALVERLTSYGYATTVRKALALDYGIPQKRERVFVLGVKGKYAPEIPPPTHNNDRSENPDLLPMPTVRSAFKGIRFKDEKGIEISGRWADALREIPPGMNYKALTAWAGHPSPLFEAETRFWNFLLKLSPDRPSWTIASQPGPWTGPFHWDNRRLTTPELAAIQGFQKNYKFSGSRRERVRQIGNAVPPAFVSAVAKNLVESFK